MAEVTKIVDDFFDDKIEQVNMTDLTAKVESVILSILRGAHTNPDKHQFRKRAKSIQFACPVCGDSKDESSKMRGHIYLEYGLYKCYNNQSCSSSLNEFLRRFDVDNIFTHAELSELQKVAISNRAAVFSTRQAVSSMDIDDVSMFLFDRDQIMKAYGACEIKDDVYAQKKLAERKIPSHKWDNLLWVADHMEQRVIDGQTKFIKHQQELLILNMHNVSKKVLNFQRRQMKAKFSGPKYMTTTFSEICEYLKVEQEEDIKKKMDIAGQYFNVFNVNWGDIVFVFEGAIDSFFMPNSVALTTSGVELKHPTCYYVYDDDETGRKQAMKMLDQYLPVFMWRKFLDENREYYRPYISKRDFNYLYQIKPFTHELMLKYFTSNPMMKLNV